MPPAPLPAPPVPANAPSPARTQFNFLAGDFAARQEARWTVAHDSPLVLAFPFLPWAIQVPPARTSINRSSMVAAILYGFDRPDEADFGTLRTMEFLTHELQASDASQVAHEYDKAKAFDTVYVSFEAWQKASYDIRSKLADPNLIRLRPAHFYETENYSLRGLVPPPELSFLYRTSIADLLPLDPVSPGSCPVLSRAVLLAGSKDTRAERDDDSSTIRVVMERVRATLLRSLQLTTASAAGLARAFYTTMDQLLLPAAFAEMKVTAWHACEEFVAAFTYTHGTATEVIAIETARVLRASRTHVQLKPILECFTTPANAYVNIDRLYLAIVPGASAATPTLTKLLQLNSVLDSAAWRSIVTHAKSSSPGIAGHDLVTMLVQSHTNVASLSSGSGPASSGAAVAAVGGEASYGSVRASSVADALRMEGARDALEKASTLSGVERVEALLQADSVLLKRAELFQEPWLLNSVAALSSCSLDEPYLRPYISQTLCEDDNTGEVPDRLLGYLVPETVIPTLRSGRWSQLPLVEMALSIKSMLTGASFLPVKDSEKYVVASSLDLVAEYGPKLFFSIGIGLSPQNGKSFEDGVNLQKKAVTFAQTLPQAERNDWLAFLNKGFLAFLDAGGTLNVSKFKTGRPELDEARIDEFAPEDTAFFVTTEARLRRAEPIADLRVAFPTLLGSKPVALPGTSSAHAHKDELSDDEEGHGNGKDKGKKKKKTKRPADELKGPGSKSHYCVELSDTELFHCGMVFKSKDIRTAFKLKEDACLAVLLSKKKGDAALELCPEHDKHGDMNQPCHKRPSNFNLDKIYKDHSRKATPKELKFANWAPNKAKK